MTTISFLNIILSIKMLKFNLERSHMRWYMPFIPATGKQREADVKEHISLNSVISKWAFFFEMGLTR